jgi:hypothetical protein
LFPNQAPDVYTEVLNQCSWNLAARRGVVVWKTLKFRVLAGTCGFPQYRGFLGKKAPAKPLVHRVPEFGVVKPLRGVF